MDWSLLIGIGVGCVTTILGGLGLELTKSWVEKKGLIDIYYISNCMYGQYSKIRLQVKNLTKSDYIMRDIRLVEVDENYTATKNFKQKLKVSQPIQGLLLTHSKADGEDGDFSFLINPRSIKDFSLTYARENNPKQVKIKFKNSDREIETTCDDFSKINDNMALQYYDENDDLITIKIKSQQPDWEKVYSVLR